MHRSPHQLGPRWCEAPPGGVLQPEVPDLHQHAASLVSGIVQRRVQHAAAVVDVPQQHHPRDHHVAHSSGVVPGALGTELKALKGLVVTR